MGSRYKRVLDEAGKHRNIHCVIWENATGLKIPEGFDIHHLNGNHRDNCIDNLALLTHSAHAALHHHLRRSGVDPVDPTDPEVVKDRQDHHESYVRNKEHAKAYKKKYSEEHKEEIAKKNHAYYETHKEQYAKNGKAYREANKEHVAEKHREYRETHREERAAYNQQYAIEHKEERSEYAKKRYQEKKDEILAQHAAYRESHREERNAYNREYKLKNQALVRAKGRLYMATKRGCSPEKLAAYQAEVDRLTKEKEAQH